MVLSLTRKIYLVLSLGFAIVLAVSITSYYSFHSYTEELKTTNHVNDINKQLDAIELTLIDLQRFERGYIITGDDEFLMLFNKTIVEVKKKLDEYDKLIASEDSNDKWSDILRSSVDRLINTYNRIIHLRKERGFEEAAKAVRSREGKLALDKIQEDINQIRFEEQLNLQKIKSSVNDKLTISKYVIVLGSFLNLVIVILFSLFLRADIKAREKAENLLKESEEEFRSIFEQAAVGAAIVSIDGKFLKTNYKLCEILGYDEKDICSLSFPDIVHPQDLKTHYDYINKILSGEITSYTTEKRYIKKDRSTIWVNVAVSVVKDEKAQPKHMIVVVEDISVRKKLSLELQNLNRELENKISLRTAQLEAANKELESFTYSVSHDLRAPLRAIDGFSKIIFEDYYDKLDQEGRRLLEIIGTNVSRMGKLIDDLLAFSRLGKQSLFKSEINTNLLINSIINDLMIDQTHRKIEFNIHKLPNIYADPNLIKQAFTNLLSNAIKYTSKKENAIIEVGANSSENENVFYIKDNGAGFDMRYYDKLFGIFQRLHTEKEFEGTGVGLALVKKIILMHEGKIWAESKLNEGAVFYLSIPKNEVN
ncbi:PAS domain S-box protein [Melioribacteraceae bacterium 4301-Me]|uniref:PAS domain S-box protein n=1 Tax=Pyranulibacter aquaticus TaxID=3163344 RepID=UPI003597CD90